MTKYLHDFFAQVTDAHKGFLVPEELYRSIVTALGSGGVVGLALMIVQGVLAHVAVIFPNPTIGGLATISLTLIIDLLRRQNQGSGPAGVPVPVAVPVPISVVAFTETTQSA